METAAATAVCKALGLDADDCVEVLQGRSAIRVPRDHDDHHGLLAAARRFDPLIKLSSDLDPQAPMLKRHYLVLPRAWERYARRAVLLGMASLVLAAIALLLGSARLAGHPKWKDALLENAHQTLAACWDWGNFSALAAAAPAPQLPAPGVGPGPGPGAEPGAAPLDPASKMSSNAHSPASPAPAIPPAEPGSPQAPRSE
jgi:hypothetical protein